MADTRRWVLSAVRSLWFVWLIVTLADLATAPGSAFSDRWNYFPNALVNIFTPVLLANIAVKSVVVLLAALLVGDFLGRRIKLRSLRLVYNLLFLFALTAAIDVMTWGTPRSVNDFGHAVDCTFTRPRPPGCMVTSR